VSSTASSSVATFLFRDWLRSHPAQASEHGAHKRALARRYRGDRDRYSEGKTELVEAVLRTLADPGTARP
jgi:GrpB-like predicted nucleotidyltransferase (UPF0157 family)